MNTDRKIEQIQSKLEKLKKSDKKYEVFGARSHKYHSAKVSDRDLSNFENKIGVNLPNDFREFILKIGYGAGPDYGIFGLEKMLSEFEEWKYCLDEQGEFSKEFDLSNEDAIELINKKKANMKGFYYKRLQTANGILPIMTEGCTYFAYIVLTGEQRGKIWRIDLNELDTMPSGVTKEYDFISWYEAWIEKAFIKINEE
ncbi:MAG: SMI1/KNR4 family protein [Bacteroidales bacterium]|nr:SMI1/KNR4 family protein [Bacteroidales bacterium]